MLRGKPILSKTVTQVLSPSFVSIIISLCLFVNLFAPGFSVVIHNRSVALHPESHTCKCNPEPHSISTCCCAIETGASEGRNLLKKDSQGVFATFMESLGCAGLPDQLSSFSYNITMPDDCISAPGMSMLLFMDKSQEIIPASAKSSPPDKPPRNSA